MNPYRFLYLSHGKRPPGEVAILMGLCNGAAFLEDQLASLAAQDHRDWSLIVSDDGSADDGPAMVARFAGRGAQPVTLVSGPRDGFSRNFLSLLHRVPATAGYAAFCDQDDIWRPGKLTRALARLDGLSVPALWCGRTILADAAGRPTGLSPLFRRPPSFANALVQSIAGGNTMVMNRPAIDLLAEAARYPGPVPSHDWWAYQVIAGAGGEVIYDPEPQVIYRQHGGNLVGANRGAMARLGRLARLCAGEMRDRTGQNIAALRFAGHLLTPMNQRLLDRLDRARAAPAARRIGTARALYRQSPLDTAFLRFALIAGRV